MGTTIIEQAKEVKQSIDFVQWAGGEGYNHLAIVFTDIIGSTRLNNQLGDDRWNQVRDAHFLRANELIGQHRGFLIKTIGDAVMAVFRDAVDALHFAIAFEANPGSEVIRIRAGVHVGRVHVRPGDTVGNEVNFAARISSKPKQGGIWFSDQVRHAWETHDPAKKLSWSKHEDVELDGFDASSILWSLPPTNSPSVVEQNFTRNLKADSTSTSPTRSVALRICIFILVPIVFVVLFEKYWSYQSLFRAGPPSITKTNKVDPSSIVESNRKLTLRDLYALDFNQYLRMSCDLPIITRSPPETNFINASVVQDYTAKSEFVTFYIASSPLTFRICEYLSQGYTNAFISKTDVVAEQRYSTDRGTESKDLTFSARVYIYHEYPLMTSEEDTLRDLFSKRGLSLMLRGNEYARQHPLRRTK